MEALGAHSAVTSHSAMSRPIGEESVFLCSQYAAGLVREQAVSNRHHSASGVCIMRIRCSPPSWLTNRVQSRQKRSASLSGGHVPMLSKFGAVSARHWCLTGSVGCSDRNRARKSSTIQRGTYRASHLEHAAPSRQREMGPAIGYPVACRGAS
jgi:hypothetical protein